MRIQVRTLMCLQQHLSTSTVRSFSRLGINKFKLVMVTVPNDGAIPSVSVGFVGLYGDLAGMSAEGITGTFVSMHRSSCVLMYWCVVAIMYCSGYVKV